MATNNAVTGKSFGERMGEVMRRIFTCGDREDEEPERQSLQVSGPTNFRREDISIPGLDEEQQRFIRDKAVADARKMWTGLQRLRSSPSGQLASPTHPSPIRVSYEEFTVPWPAPQPGAGAHRRTTSGQRLAENLRSHGRKLSASLKSPLGPGGYHAVGSNEGGIKREDSKHEMRGLMDIGGKQTSAGKLSCESNSVGGDDFRRDVLMAGGKI